MLKRNFHWCAKAALLICATVSSATAQHQPEPAKAEKAKPREDAEADEGKEKEGPEGEFIASNIFRSGLFLTPVWKGLSAEVHYFGTEGESPVDTIFTGANWAFRWKKLTLAPGLSVASGRGVQVAPMVTFRWALKSNRWISEGFWFQSLRAALHEKSHEGAEEPYTRYASVLDNVHFSVRAGPFELGPIVERIQYREENEWKGGVRVGCRVHKHIRLLFYALGPGREFRGGIAFQ